MVIKKKTIGENCPKRTCAEIGLDYITQEVPQKCKDC